MLWPIYFGKLISVFLIERSPKWFDSGVAAAGTLALYDKYVPFKPPSALNDLLNFLNRFQELAWGHAYTAGSG